MSPRAELVALLQGAFPSHNVYGSPPGKIELPAIVIAPDSPYVIPVTFTLYEWHFQTGFVTGRTNDNQDLDTLDSLIEQAWPVLQSLPELNVQQVRSVDAMEIAGTPYVAAIFPVTVKGINNG